MSKDEQQDNDARKKLEDANQVTACMTACMTACKTAVMSVILL